MGAASLFRQAIARQLAPIANCSEHHVLRNLAPMPKISPNQQFGIPGPKLGPTHDPRALCQQLAEKFEPSALIPRATASGTFLHFDVCPDAYIQHTLRDVYAQSSRYGMQEQETPKTVVLDYSSPNIAKPFHAGHLRSTIIGNFVKRIHEAMGYKTIGINYLGDWGKQYGLLAVGYERYGNETALENDPIHHLYDVYVRINKDTDPEIDALANAYFKRMEEGDPITLKQWRRFRDLSIASYADVYRRLGITFDRYSGESEAEPYIPRVYEELRDRIVQQDDGAWIVDSTVLRRADGTSLYMTRDLASVLLRRHDYAFDKAVYIIGNEQESYLRTLFGLTRHLQGCDHLDMAHVGFGRIHGMSTRKGTVVFLQDILDTARQHMLENMQADENKYRELREEGIYVDGRHLAGQEAVAHVADRLGTSAVMVQDMVAKRGKNYTFAWDRMTAARGYTGVYLQFTHARMCSIERKSQVPIHIDCDLSQLKEKEALDLALTISQYPDVVQSAYQTLEPCTVVQYLFRLSHCIGQANARLRVKGVDSGAAEARMLLYWAAKTTLANGLKLIGVEPLDRM